MSKLILTRHGQSIWNAENRFTGWVDIDLSEQGILEARKSGKLIKNLNISINTSYASFLKRAIKTLAVILEENNLELSLNTSWEINERHYGSLTGLNKEETKKKIGEEQFKKYRRSWNISPPPMSKNDKNQFLFGPLNAGISQSLIPLTESLKDTYDRAHGNSLRALCKKLFNISNEKINELEIPTGNPLVIEFDQNLKIKDMQYLDRSREKTIITNQ